MFVILHTETNVWTVGFFEPTGRWNALKDFSSLEEAEHEVHYLNGGQA